MRNIRKKYAMEIIKQFNISEVYTGHHMNDEIENKSGEIFISINEIKDAIEKKQVTCFYREIIDTKTSQISHYEALLRIIDKNGNIVLPEKISPIVKGTFILRNITNSKDEKSFRRYVKIEEVQKQKEMDIWNTVKYKTK